MMLELNFNPFPVLETERLSLRNFTMGDANDVFSYRGNAEAMKYISRPVHQSVEEARAMVQKINDNVTSNEAIGWAITLKGSSKVIGSVSFHRIEKGDYRAELGYMVHPDYWRQGIIGEAVKAALDYGFNELNFHSVEAIIDPDNIASQKVLEKFNFVKEAHFKENYFFNGKFVDSAVYSLLKRNYLK
jgi:ribosomal-protein-alanine N-acetyltransferase